MRFTIERDAALSAITRTQGVALRKGTIPILGNVMLAADRGSLTIVGTDLDLEAASVAVAKVDEPGSVTVPAQTLFEILRSVPQGADIGFTLSAAPQRLTVQCGRSRFQLPTLPSADFPVFAPPQSAARGVLEAGILRRLIDRTQFAMAGGTEARAHLHCLHLSVVSAGPGNKVLRAAATDGHRLAAAWTPCPESLLEASAVMLGKKTVSEVRALCEDENDGAVELALSATAIEASRGSHRLTSKVVDGTYPDISRVIPRDPCEPIRLDAKMLAGAVRRCSIMASKAAVNFALEAGGIALSSRNSEGGQADEYLEVAYDGPGMSLAFNAGYLADALGLMAGAVELEIRSPNDPAKLLDPGDPSSLFVLMPLRF